MVSWHIDNVPCITSELEARDDDDGFLEYSF